MRAIVTVIGRDQVGIIAAVCALLSEKNVNVLDISQTVLQEYFTMIMLVDAGAATVPFARLREDLAQAGQERGLDIRIQREDICAALHGMCGRALAHWVGWCGAWKKALGQNRGTGFCLRRSESGPAMRPTRA